MSNTSERPGYQPINRLQSEQVLDLMFSAKMLLECAITVKLKLDQNARIHISHYDWDTAGKYFNVSALIEEGKRGSVRHTILTEDDLKAGLAYYQK